MKEKNTLFELKKLTHLILNEIEVNMDEESKNKFPSPTQIRIIGYIIEHDNNVLQKELENALGISRATVSDVLKTMEKNNLIERVQSDIDTRTNKVILKESAIKKLEEGKTLFELISSKMYENISNDELILFNSILNKMIVNLENKKGKEMDIC